MITSRRAPRRILSVTIAGLGAVALAATGALSASAVAYPTSNSSIGLAQTDVWTASSSGAAAVVAKSGGGEVLQINAGGGVMHNMVNQSYPSIDNVLPARLPWANVFTGGVNDQIDPATGAELQPTGVATVEVNVPVGAQLFVDAVIGYGDSADSLENAYLSCELIGSGWTTVNLQDCFSTDNPGLEWHETNWVVTQDWTYNDPWMGPKSYTAGQHQSITMGYSEVEVLAGIGFRVEGAGSALIDDLTIRDHVIDFSAVATTSTLTATTTGPAVPGAEVTITAQVSPAAAGSFVIKDGGTTLGDGAAVDGTFTVTTSALTVGTHSLTAVFTPADAASFTASATPAMSFSVNTKKAPPANPPAASAEELIADDDVVQTPNTAFTPVGSSADLNALDPSKALSGNVPWADDADSFVDVYAYSAPIFLGTFPVINGQVQLTGLDLSALAQGGHHLVFVGQTSNSVSVMAVTVAALLPATGADVTMPLIVGGALLVVGLVVVVVAKLRRRP